MAYTEVPVLTYSQLSVLDFNEETPNWRSWLHQFTPINTEKDNHRFKENCILLFVISTGTVN